MSNLFPDLVDEPAETRADAEVDPFDAVLTAPNPQPAPRLRGTEGMTDRQRHHFGDLVADGLDHDRARLVALRGHVTGDGTL